MAEQQQLDLPPPAPRPTSKPAYRSFAGLTRAQLALGTLLLAGLVWGMWVTRSLTAPRQDRIVSARLSSIVGDYVSAEARSASPPAQVEAEMRAFMAGLDRELQQRSAHGEVVLVGEAVLTKNVPDITDSLRRAVIASGVPMPHQASAAELQRLQLPATVAAPAAPSPMAAGPAAMPSAPITSGFAMPPSVVSPGPVPGRAASAASVATFGGPDGNGSR